MDRIQSIHFDVEKQLLEINGKTVEKAIVFRWPETLDNEAWPLALLMNESKEDGLARFEKREELPVLKLIFEDGTGSARISGSIP